MSYLFIAQLTAWLLLALGSIWVFFQALDYSRKAKRIPAACHLTELDTMISTREAEFAELTRRRGELTSIIELQERQRAEGLNLLREVQAAREWKNDAEKNLLLLPAERQEQEALRQELAVLRDELRATKLEIIADKDTARAELNQLRAEFEQLESAKAKTEAEYRGVSQNLQISHLTLARLAQELTEKQAIAAELQGVESRLTLAEASLDTKTTVLTELATEISRVRAEADKLNKECRSNRIEIDTQKGERDALINQIEALRQLADKTVGALGKTSAEDRYRDLWEPLPFKVLKSRPIGPEQAAIQKTEDYLKSRGLRFAPRTLNAFHTALKSADISPVTVLAGISGTGKSELPKRYAEGMGIHFVGLPVQPRWDSPTDLFGFFNHLEGRFKATDLARAMVQFEQYTRSTWTQMPKGWNHGLEDQMLLVLLDEMNLARVEYYFSDFLSRLETRRGVDNPKLESDRAKAELALDMGSLAKDERPIRFYPGRNVLFTGTMNEDESTQSLSDKVLDRACVLRFGRPKKLTASVKGARGTPSVTALSSAEWENWLTGARPTNSDLDDKINKLNSAMEEMGRPFGHRVGQAISTYVSQYPDWIPNRDKLALADQIEQRILPKLRGMDTADFGKPLATIEEILKSTEDTALIAAFQSGRRDGSFLWRGVDRDV